MQTACSFTKRCVRRSKHSVMLVSTDRWERAPGEPARAYHAFCHFRDAAPATVSIDRAWREHASACAQKGLNEVSHRRRPTSWARWSVAWDWIGRRDCYLAYVDGERRRKFLKEQQEATARHVRMVVAAQQALAVQLRATLEVTNTPAALGELKALYTTGGTGLQRALVEGREAI